MNDLEIGGRNLFKKTDVLNINAYVGAASQGQYSGTLNFASNRSCIVIEVEEGETYSVSYKEHKVGNRFSFGFYTGYEEDVPPATVGKFDWWQFPESNGKFEGYTVPQGCNYLIVYLANTAFNINKIPVGFKVEKGNKATDWTPAPEDVEASIETAKTEAESAAKAYADTKAEAERVIAEAYADGIVSDEEQARIDDVNAKLAAANAYAEAQDALLKAQQEAYADG